MKKRDRREEEEGEELSTLEAVTLQLERANNIFHGAVTTTDRSRRKELLEEALREYAALLPLLNPYRKDPWCRLAIRTVLDKIHAVEHWIELEIVESMTDSISKQQQQQKQQEAVDQALAEARLLLQQKQID